MLKYAKKYWCFVALSFALTVASTFVNTYIPILLTKTVVDDVLIQRHYDRLGYYLFLAVGLYGLTSIISFVQRYVNSYTSQRIVFDIRNELFAALQKKSFSFYDQTQTGQLMSRATSDVDRINMFYSFWMNSLFGMIITVVFVAYFLIGMDVRLTTVALLVLPIISLLNYHHMKREHPIHRGIREQYGVLNSFIQQNIVGVKVVRAFTSEDLEINKFTGSNKKFFDLNMEAARLRSIYQPLTTFLLSLSIAILYWYGGGEVIQNTLSLGALLTFSQYITMLTRPVSFIGRLIVMYTQALAAGKRIFEIIDSEPEIKDKPNAVELPPIKGRVTFGNVSFGYDKNRSVLKNIDLAVDPGETVAILGATGSGKSTLIYLIPRFYDITQGKLLIDDHDIRDVTLKSLRNKVGIVLQDIFLFSTTIKENIAFGKPDATMEEITNAAKLAQAHDFIMSFPKGYDTIVGERGITLSGGQKQRVAIARTLLMDPKILIVDDSTSFVDTRTEQAIQNALRALLKDRTTFIITQRVSTIKNANRIIVLDKGEIVEEGTHEELLALNGIYARIYRTQFAPVEEVLLAGSREVTGG